VRPAAVPALDGQVQVRVPPGTQSGTVLRVDGMGLPRYPGHGRGSLNVTVIVDIPRQLSPWQRLLYEDFATRLRRSLAELPMVLVTSVPLHV